MAPVTTGPKDVRIWTTCDSYQVRRCFDTCLVDYTEGAELVDQVLDVVRKEAEGTECLQGITSQRHSEIVTDSF